MQNSSNSIDSITNATGILNSQLFFVPYSDASIHSVYVYRLGIILGYFRYFSKNIFAKEVIAASLIS